MAKILNNNDDFYANAHPYKVVKTEDTGYYANAHPLKVVVVGDETGGGDGGANTEYVDKAVAEAVDESKGYTDERVEALGKTTTEIGFVQDATGTVLQYKGTEIGDPNTPFTNNVPMPLATEDYAGLASPTDVAKWNKASTALGNLNRTMLEDLEFNASASSVSITENKVNLNDGSTTVENNDLPMASATSAGLIDAEAYKTIQETVEKTNSLEKGAVATDNLLKDATQEQITAEWKSLSSIDEPYNGAKIYDTQNNKEYTYFANTNTWVVTQDGLASEVKINNFTTTAPGLIASGEEDGEVEATTNGKGKVVGWNAKVTDINNLKSSVETLNTNLNSEIANREQALEALEEQVKGVGGTKVAKVVNTYADLSGIKDLNTGDYVAVLTDEEHENKTTFYTYTKGAEQLTDVYFTGTTSALSSSIGQAEGGGIEFKNSVNVPGGNSWQIGGVAIRANSETHLPITVFVDTITTATSPVIFADGSSNLPGNEDRPEITFVNNGTTVLPIEPKTNNAHASWYNVANATIPAGTVLKFRAYEGVLTTEPTASSWDYVGSVAGDTSGQGDITLYNEYSDATDGANTAGFIKDKLAGEVIALGQRAIANPNSIALSGSDSVSGTIKANTGSIIVSNRNGSANRGDVGSWAHDNIIIGNSRSISGADSQHVAQNIVLLGNDNINSATITKMPAETVGIGYGSYATRANEVSFGYGSTNRYLTHVKDAEEENDAVNLGQLNNAKNKAWTANTAYVAGELVTNEGKIYTVTSDFTSGATFDDLDLEELSGGTVTVANAYGDSETTPISQKFMSDRLNTNVLLGTNPTTANSTAIGAIAIGNASKAYGDADNIYSGIAVGSEAQATKTGSIAVGVNAQSLGNSSVAIGADVYIKDGNSVGIGTNTQIAGTHSISIEGEIGGNNSIAIGYQSYADGAEHIALGHNAIVSGIHSMALGTYANANPEEAGYSVAIGNYSTATRDYEFSVGNLKTHNGVTAFTRYVAGVTAGVNDTDAVNVAQLKEAKNRVWQPNTAYIAGELITNDGTLYQVTTSFTSDTEFAEDNLEAIGGGGSVNVVNAYGTSTTDAISQKFINDKLNNSEVILGRNATGMTWSVAIGDGAKSTGYSSIALGGTVNKGTGESSTNTNKSIAIKGTTNGMRNIAIGANATTNNEGSIAIGSSPSGVSDQGATVVSNFGIAIGSASSSIGDNSIVIGKNSSTAGTTYSHNSIAIGASASVDSSTSSIAIGSTAKASSAPCSVAIGRHAEATNKGSIAFGWATHTTRDNEVSFGWTTPVADGSLGTPPQTRYLANVTAGVLETDAVNVKQLNDAVGNIEALLTAIDTGAGVGE